MPPPEYLVLRCYKCQMHQVLQRNKQAKFACKVCTEKQSFKTIFASGTDSRKLRSIVQELNMKMGEKERALQDARMDLEEEKERSLQNARMELEESQTLVEVASSEASQILSPPIDLWAQCIPDPTPPAASCSSDLWTQHGCSELMSAEEARMAAQQQQQQQPPSQWGQQWQERQAQQSQPLQSLSQQQHPHQPQPLLLPQPQRLPPAAQRNASRWCKSGSILEELEIEPTINLRESSLSGVTTKSLVQQVQQPQRSQESPQMQEPQPASRWTQYREPLAEVLNATFAESNRSPANGEAQKLYTTSFPGQAGNNLCSKVKGKGKGKWSRKANLQGDEHEEGARAPGAKRTRLSGVHGAKQERAQPPTVLEHAVRQQTIEGPSEHSKSESVSRWSNYL